MIRLTWILSLALLAGSLTTGVATRLQAAPTPEQRREVSALESAIIRAGRLYGDGKHEESGELVRDVQSRLEKLVEAGGKDVLPLVDGIYSRLVRAHALLELEGVPLEPLKKPEAAPATPTPSPMPAAGGEGGFLQQVAPMLVAKCGRCHVNDAKGEFSMASFANLMKGTPAGVVIFPGDPQGSRLVEVIESGDMPRGGGKVTPEELASLKKWIAAGARFDGPSPEASLAGLVRVSMPNQPMALSAAQATGKETVSFSKDIAPVLVANCSGCHINADRPRGNFNMSTYTVLLRGGDSGAPLVRGQPAESLLVQKLLGKGGGERMPLNRPPLAEELIAKIEQWIREGATFDAPDPGQNIVEVAAIAKATLATHEELSSDRAALAAQNWKLGMPGVPMEKTESANFLAVGSVGEATLAEYGELAESIAPKVAAFFKTDSDQPLIKGRMTLYFFPDRYSYSEFGKMIEKRDLPREYRGHWRYSIVDAYGAILPPRGDEYALQPVIGQQLAGVYIASLGKVPHWFTEGSARVVASRIDPKDPRVQAWDTELSRVISGMSKPDEFLGDRMAAEDADIASYSFVKFLMKDVKRYDGLLKALREGEAFDEAFPRIYGGTPSQAAELWARATLKSGRRR